MTVKINTCRAIICSYCCSVQLQALTSTSWLNSFLWPFFALGISFDVFFFLVVLPRGLFCCVVPPCNTAGAVSLRFCSFLVLCTQHFLLGSCIPCKTPIYIPSLMDCLRLCSQTHSQAAHFPFVASGRSSHIIESRISALYKYLHFFSLFNLL